jgi:oxalate decarboxylase/phosphoglucose isomerase-like protein (cupin superfamily)
VTAPARRRQVFGMVEESTPQGNVLVNRHVRAGQTIHIPQGLQHFSHNPTCLGAQFLANFATADPGAPLAIVALQPHLHM